MADHIDSTDHQAAPLRKGVPLWAQIVIWIGLLVLLVILAIGLLRTQQGTIQKGQVVEEFTLQLFSGYEYAGDTEINLADLRGKLVVINFWASWCKPCEHEAAELEAAWRYYQESGEVVFIGVDYVDTEPEARSYLAKFDITFPSGPDKGTRISQMFRIRGVPETYFIDRQGVLREIQLGPFQSLDEIIFTIDELLTE
jgi:cytochrome c biogenesis protein CcmG/thiol:disulfide interchange protein DsbE